MSWYFTCEYHLFKFAESVCVTGSYYRLSISVLQVLLDLKRSIFVKTSATSNVLVMEPQTQETKLTSTLWSTIFSHLSLTPQSLTEKPVCKFPDLAYWCFLQILSIYYFISAVDKTSFTVITLFTLNFLWQSCSYSRGGSTEGAEGHSCSWVCPPTACPSIPIIH